MFQCTDGAVYAGGTDVNTGTISLCKHIQWLACLPASLQLSTVLDSVVRIVHISASAQLCSIAQPFLLQHIQQSICSAPSIGTKSVSYIKACFAPGNSVIFHLFHSLNVTLVCLVISRAIQRLTPLLRTVNDLESSCC